MANYYRTIKRGDNIYFQYVEPDGSITEKMLKEVNPVAIADDLQMTLRRVDNVVISILNSEVRRFLKKDPFPNERLSRVDLTFLKGYEARIYDPNYQKYLTRILDTITSAPPLDERTQAEKIRIWLKQVTVIGKGFFGVAASSGINKVNGILVFKFNTKSGHSIAHEFVVGKILNSLRDSQRTINFVYTYGAFNCGQSPIVDRRLPAFCHNDSPNSGGKYAVDHLMIENITNAKSFYSFVSTRGLTIEQYLSVFLQLFYALSVANSEHGFTHWDLHGENILIKSEARFADYWNTFTTVAGNERVDVKTFGNIPYIIDYGQATIQTPSGAYLGPVSSAIPRDYFSGQPFLLFDLYKIIIGTLWTIHDQPQQERNQQIATFGIRCVQKLFFLPTEDLQRITTILQKLRPTKAEVDGTSRQRIPFVAAEANNSGRLADMIYDIIRSIGIDPDTIRVFNRKPDGRVLSCSAGPNGGKCLRQPKENPPNVYTNYLDVCYAGKKLTSLDARHREEIALGFISDEEELAASINKQSLLLLEITNELLPIVEQTKAELVYLETILPDNVVLARFAAPDYSVNFLAIIIKYYSEVVELWSNIEKMADLYHVAVCINLASVKPKENNNIHGFLTDSYASYQKRIVPATQEIRRLVRDKIDSGDAVYGAQIRARDLSVFFANWGLYQYIIEEAIVIDHPSGATRK